MTATPSQPLLCSSPDACVEAALSRLGKRIVLGLPVGIGKANPIANAFVRRALADRSLDLTIFTALSLRTPRFKSDLERRFLEPFVRRVFGPYPELEYVALLERGALPPNIRVTEFFLEPGGWLHNAQLQQNYLSANYTHVARDLLDRGVNVIAQLAASASDEPDHLSLSCNPDLTVDLLAEIRARRSTAHPILLLGQIHPQLPFMYGDARIAREEFDILLDARPYDFPLFCPPNLPIGTADHAIALHVAALIRDGGTLQLGIGELGDAIVYALKLRHERPETYGEILDQIVPSDATRQLIAAEGGRAPFLRGLYGCTEMLVDGFIDLYRAGILKRCVYPHAVLQDLLDRQIISSEVDANTLEALAGAGIQTLSAADFASLQLAGVFRDEVVFQAGELRLAQHRHPARLGSATERAALAAYLGRELRNGVLVHGAFFMGPKAFYRALRELPPAERRRFAMQRISFVNELYGNEALKRAQRLHARFVNSTMMVTGLGAAVSDGLASGAVVSGVGGQYNFVTMAHALKDARSILCVRSTRSAKGEISSNIVWNYAHVTIPRHLRDIVVTEYGIADLRGRTDREVVEALVRVMDARFQDEFVAQAKSAGKLPDDYRAPPEARDNTPRRLENLLAPWRRQGMFGALPFGSDFTDDELVIAKALRSLQSDSASFLGRVRAILAGLTAGQASTETDRMLERLDLGNPATLSLKLMRGVVANALRKAQRDS